MTESQMKLTPLEEKKALTDAGISLDMDTWDDFTLDLAYRVVEEAQNAKIERLTFHRRDAYLSSLED